MFKRLGLAALLAIVIATLWLGATFNSYQSEGELQLAALDAPATVRRDAMGIPYIHAQSLADALRVQGFLIGQDRLYQAELYKHIGQGRLAELVGESGAATDIQMRLVGIQAIAASQVALLSDNARNYYLHYLEGLNDYIENHRDEHPASLKLLGLTPKPWTLQDIIALQYFQMWGSTANWRAELLAQQLIDTLGIELANDISIVSVNPDDEVVVSAKLLDVDGVGLSIDPATRAAMPEALGVASNAWASDGKKSAGGMPILSNSPHIDARTMPGFWYPMGLFTPEVRAIGAAAPGTPGFGIARTEDIVFGGTNGYSDGVDLYIETLDPDQPDHYLEGDISKALVIREETMRIKDSNAEGGYRELSLRIRSTSRGPLISDHGMTLDDGRAISLRWATVGQQTDSIGTDQLLLARTVDEARQAMMKSPTPLSNVVVDRHGDIARIASGHVPVRLQGDGSRPFVVRDSTDNWAGVIPASEMPVDIRPERGWVGTANHRLVPHDYPYEYSTWFSPSWRYRRILEFMEGHPIVSMSSHWELINDVKNPMAAVLVPQLLEALAAQQQSQGMAKALADWDHFDTRGSAGAAVFQVMMKHIARRTYGDEIKDELLDEFINTIYYWQERLVLLSQQPDNRWFDDQGTEAVESRDDIYRLAAVDALADIEAAMGPDPAQWAWGKLLTITFASPVIPGETFAKWFGGGVHPMFGSAETLNRGGYKMADGYEASFIDSVRFVADMSDTEKVIAVIPGGVSGRYLDSTLANQTDAWLAGDSYPWWFSDEAIEKNTVKSLRLAP